MMRPVAKVEPQIKITNRSDIAYAEHLEQRRLLGEIHEWHYARLTLLLAPDCRYTPDFLVVRTDGVCELHEVKGFWRDDAKAKARVCADMFPFKLFIVTAVKKADGGGWKVEEL